MKKRLLKNIVMVVLIIGLVSADIYAMYAANNGIETIFITEEKNDSPLPSNGLDEQSNLEENQMTSPSDNQLDTPSTPPEAKDDITMDKQTQPDEQINDIRQDVEENSLDTIYYVIFACINLMLAISIMYLLMSKFNKLSFKETLKNLDKVIIFILSAIILSVALTILSIYCTHFFQKQTSTSEDNQTLNSTSSISYTSAQEITTDTTIDSGSYTSSNSNENVFLISGDIQVTLKNLDISKTGDSDGSDDSNFYGINSAILAKDQAVVNISDVTINTEASGANGTFSYGGSATTNNASSDGSTINISDSTITTSGDNAGGIMTTGGGITNATNLTINTSGTSSAAIRSDRGGGMVKVSKGTYTTTGVGSPVIYSTATISVSDATLVSKTSEGVVIEGLNSVTIDNCTLTDNNTKLNGQSTTYKNIFLYQSASGDAQEGNSTFTATSSTITTNNGDTFYITNTAATINLENNKIASNDEEGYFLRAQADSWGSENNNGAEVTLNMTNQIASGNIFIDDISTLDMQLTNNSSYEGAINTKNTAKEINLTLDKTSTITLSADTYVSSFEDEDSSYSNIDFNGYTLYVNNKALN